MDTFLRGINSETFKVWVLSQTSNEYNLRVNPTNKNKIIISYNFCKHEKLFW